MAVVSYIRKCTDTQKVDNSLIRHFVTEVSQIIESPYCVSAIHAVSYILFSTVGTGHYSTAIF